MVWQLMERSRELRFFICADLFAVFIIVFQIRIMKEG